MRKIFSLIMAFTLAAMAPACGNTGGKGNSASSSGATAFIITTDRTTGAFSLMNVSSRAATANAGSVHSDAEARLYSGLIYVVNRLGADNVQVIDPNDGFSTSRQFSVGAGSNPQDIAFASDSKAYVSRLESSEILIVNPSTGETMGTIDLSAYADSDGVPEMAALHIKDGRLYVAIQALDRNAYWSPTGMSVVVVINTATDGIITSIQLPYQNPYGRFIELSDGRLAIPCTGAYSSQDGGVAVIDPAGETAVEGIVSEAALGGDLNKLALTSDSSGFAVITDGSFNTILVRFDAGAGTVETVFQPGGFSIDGITVNGAELWVSDRTAENPGVRIFDTDSGAQLTGDPISVGLPPSQILFL